MKIIFTTIIFSVSLLVGAGFCQSKSTEESIKVVAMEEPPQMIVSDAFVLPDIPEVISEPEERAKYLVMHYWDRFDFSNRDLIVQPEITEQALADYINILGYVPKDNVNRSLLYTLERAKVDTAMYQHFLRLFEKYLYEPNSPFYNEGYYCFVLKDAENSTLLKEEERVRYRFQLEMAMLNPVGQKANDFVYTIASGESFHLYDLRSKYTLLMFTDPDCDVCASATKFLAKSQVLNGMLSLNTSSNTRMTVLTVSLDSGYDEWAAHSSEIPKQWIYAYDKGGVITAKRLYDIKAFPTIYLLDENKKVVEKDISIEKIESVLSSFYTSLN